MALRLARAVLAPASKAFTRTSEWNTKIRRVFSVSKGRKGCRNGKKKRKEKRRGGWKQGETGTLTGIAKGEGTRIGDGMVDSDWRNGRAGKPFADWLIRSSGRSNQIQKQKGRGESKRTEQTAQASTSTLPTDNYVPYENPGRRSCGTAAPHQ